MSISLNNHEDRIKALENSGITNPTVLATNTYGTAIKFGGLIIQGGWFNNGRQFSRTITFPKVFSKVCTFTASGNHGGLTVSTSSAVINDTHYGSDKPPIIDWIAIGILYTYRYIIKSLLIFTPLSYLFNKEV